MDQSDLGAGSKNEQRVTTTLDRRTFLKVAGGAIGSCSALPGRAVPQRACARTVHRPRTLLAAECRLEAALRAHNRERTKGGIGLSRCMGTNPADRTEVRLVVHRRRRWAKQRPTACPFALSITAGINTLPWVYDAGVQRFEFQARIGRSLCRFLGMRFICGSGPISWVR